MATDRDGSAPTVEERIFSRHGVEGEIIGRTLGDFVVKELLGSGGFGSVYRAEQLTLGREVVIKVLRWEAGDEGVPGETDAERVQRFLREARLASRLDHPYAAHIYAFGAEPDGVLWLAMELVRGTPLNELLELQGPLPINRFVPLLEKICEVVHTAHQQGIVHRDIKPANVMVLSRAGRLLPKLLDFGIARLTDETRGTAVTGDSAEQDHESFDSPHQRMATPLPVAPLDDESDSAPSDSLTSALGGQWRIPDLTRRGLYLGSPPYMAPEQWVDATKADARTDQYAIAVLAYQALTGRVPFRAKSDPAMARAHASKSVPKLGDSFPLELDRVFTRAMAKKARERYSQVLEMADAFRAAAGLDIEPDRMPRLDPFMRDTFIAEAPQSLADAVALLDACNTRERIVAAAGQVIWIAVRLLGLLSLACHSRTGIDLQDNDSTRAMLALLHRRGLDSSEWLALARALTEPFTGKADAYPIPELVLLLGSAGREGSTAALLDELTALEISLSPGSTASNPEPTDDRTGDTSSSPSSVSPAGSSPDTPADTPAEVSLTEVLGNLARLLKALSFLCEYPLVVQRAGRPEVWMGARRAVRPEATLRDDSELRDGEVVLTGSSGDLVLTLGPLFQVLAPAPGAPDELFLFDGPGRYGARLVAFPVGFERHDSELWRWYDEHVVGLDGEHGDSGSDSDSDRQSPYMGLSSFSPGDSRNFFGREREAEACVNRLRIQPLLAVVGPSGAGKSSFVKAGVVPALPATWSLITARPGPTPVAQLQSSLLRAGIEPGDLRARLEADRDALADLLRAHAEEHGVSVFLVIDQFEELLTLCLDEDERRLYADGLMRAARHERDPVRVVITLRDDFLLRAQQLAPLRERLGQSLQLLTTPPPDDLERILVEPARRAGYEFEDDALPSEMVTSVVGEPGALALLSFTASKLWELRDRHFRRLQRRAYETLGGVGGALSQHAEETLASMPDEQRTLVREAFRQLVTADGTRAILTRRELSQMLGSTADKVLEDLIHARLLVASEGEGGEDRVEVVHEALLSSWPRLVRWQREDAESARLRDQLRAATRQWVERDQPRGLLWRGDALLEYRVWRSRYRGTLTEDEERFVLASKRDDARGRRHRRIALIAAFAILCAGLIILFDLRQQANDERDRANVQRDRASESAELATRRLVDLHVEQGRQALLEGEPMRAFAYLLEARRTGAEGSDVRFLLARATDGLDGQLAVLHEHRGEVWVARFSHDGSRVLTAGSDRTARIWDPESGRLLATLRGHEERIWDARFSPDDSFLVTAGWDGAVTAWDPVTGQPRWSRTHGGRLRWVDFGRDGREVVTASASNTIKFWTGDTGELLRTVEVSRGERLTAATLSPNGEYLLLGTYDGIAQSRNTRTGEVVFEVGDHGGNLPAVAVSRDSDLAATASWGNIARVFPLAGGEVRTLAAHVARVTHVAFSPDGSRVVTASEDRTAKIWDVRTGEQQLDLKGHASGVTFASYSPDGERILTASRDNTLRTWDARSGLALWTFVGHRDGAWGAHFDATGSRFVTSGFDGTVRIWNARQSGYTLALPRRDSDTLDARSSPDGGRIATVHHDGTVRVWDDQGEVERTMVGDTKKVPNPRYSVSWHPDGTRLITAIGQVATVWDVATGESIMQLGDHGAHTFHAAYDSRGERVVTAGADGTASVWNGRTGELLITIKAHTAGVRHAEFHPDGTRIITAGNDQMVRVWNVATGDEALVLEGHSLQVNSARFSPDGALIISAAEDKTARVWTESGDLVAVLEGHDDALPDAALSPDGQLAATASEDGSIQVWHLESRRVLWSVDLRLTRGRSVQFISDGSALLGGFGRTAHIWRVSYDERTVSELQAFAACRVRFTVDEGLLGPTDLDPAACD